MRETFYAYDPVQALESPGAVDVFIADALDTGDAAYIAKAMAAVSRARGAKNSAKKADPASDPL